MEEVIIRINNVLLAAKMNNSLLSLQDITDHMATYVQIPENWLGKNYRMLLNFWYLFILSLARK